MNKSTIQIIIIVVALSITGYVFYNVFFNNGSGPPVAATSSGNLTGSASGIQSPKDLLPYGTTMDFSIFHSPNGPQFDFPAVSYPQLQPSQEIGTSESNLISGPSGH